MVAPLMEYVAGKSVKSFKPVPHYFCDGDYASYFTNDERCYTERVDELLTVYYSFQTRELVGCKIKGVARVIETCGNFGVSVHHGSAKLSVLMLAAAFEADPANWKVYRLVGKMAGEAIIDNLPMAA